MTNSLTLTQLEYLVAVDTYRHFGVAAKHCHVSQPTLSMQLQKLEDTLGFAVFDRSRKPIIATERGRQIVEHARTILREASRLYAVAKGQTESVRGSFTLGVIPTVSTYLLPLFLARFSDQYPEVQLRIREMETEQIVRGLERESIDAGLLATPVADINFDTLHLYYEPFVYYCGLEHPLANRARLTDEDALQRPIWLLEEGHCLRGQVLKFCGTGGPVIPQVAFQSGSLETIKRIVESGSGGTILPWLAVPGQGLTPPVSRGKAIAFQKPVPSREISLMYMRAQLKRPTIDALAEVIKTNVPKELRRLTSAQVENFEVEL